MTDTLLTTKLYIPPTRISLVPRKRLAERLSEGVRARLVLVSAPAGFGKTTLLSEWARDSGMLAGWVSLDQDDDDLVRFWTYVIVALQSALPVRALGETVIASLQATPAPPIETVLTGLINELADISTPITLILDDYHLINQQAIHLSITFLLDHMPESLQLVIASREDPPLPLARMRVRGQLSELTAADLRFTDEEATSFLNDVMELHVSVNEAAALEARTEGWIAALQVAALSLRSHPDTASFIRQFQGDHRYLLDYMAEEILQQLPPAVQQFLLYTSILDRFNAPLCDALTQTSVARGMLKRIERANLFLVPLDDDRQWYRFHHLFADFLYNYLQLEYPDVIAELHLRAGTWLADNGFPEAAVEHALAAADYGRAAGLVEQLMNDSFRYRTNTRAYRWLSTLPEEVIQPRPILSLALAWGLCRDGQYQLSEMWLLKVEDHYHQAENAALPHLPSIGRAMLSEIESVRALIACFKGDMPAAMTLSRQALANLPVDEHVLRGLLANNMAMNIADAVGGSGDLAAAGQIYREAVAAGQASGNNKGTAFALNRLGQWRMEQGKLRKAANTFEEALQLVSAHPGPSPSAEIGLAHMGLGELAFEWNQLPQADNHIGIACEHFQTGNPIMLPPAYSSRAFVLQAQGKPDKAREHMSQAVELARNSNISWITSNVSAARALLALHQGDLGIAVHWADTCGLDVGDELGINHLAEYTTLARIRFALRQTQEASDLLSWLHDFVKSLELAGRLVEVQLLQALIYQALGRQAEAVTKLTAAVTGVSPEGYIRLFLDQGKTLVQLLDQVTPADTLTTEYLAQLQRAFASSGLLEAQSKYTPLLEPLSDREIEVLRLLAAGMSSSEIALELTIAVSTVRSHRKNIYSKLNAHSRYEAVLQAQELQIL